MFWLGLTGSGRRSEATRSPTRYPSTRSGRTSVRNSPWSRLLRREQLMPIAHLGVLPILDLQPGRRAAIGAIRPARPLPDHPFRVTLARHPEQIAAALRQVIEVQERTLDSRNDAQQPVLALEQRQHGQILAVDVQDVERVEVRPLAPEHSLLKCVRPTGSRQQISPLSVQVPGRRPSDAEPDSGGVAFVAMVEPADLRPRHDPGGAQRLDGASLRRVLAEREVRSRALVVRDVGSQHPPAMSLPEDNNVVQTLATDGPDDPFDEGFCQGERGDVRSTRGCAASLRLTWRNVEPGLKSFIGANVGAPHGAQCPHPSPAGAPWRAQVLARPRHYRLTRHSCWAMRRGS